jgi:hypothetical protein
VSFDRAGMASGVSGVCRQLGTAFGIALLGAILTNQYNTGVHDRISGLTVPNTPPTLQHVILGNIISGLQAAGTFVGSTGLHHIPPQFVQYAHSPITAQIQLAVQQSFIDGTVNIFRLAAVLIVIGMFAALFLVKRADMVHLTPGKHVTAVE